MAHLGSYFKRFVHGISHRDQVEPHVLYDSAEQLLMSVHPARPSVLQFYTIVMQDYFRLRAQNSSFPNIINNLESVLHRVLDIITNLLNSGEGASYRDFCVMVCQWCLNNLGELSRKFSNSLIGQTSGQTLDYIGSKWREYSVARHLIDVTELSFPSVSNMSDSQEDDHAIKILLQASSRYSPYFDWMIAHLGGQYPEVIIRRTILSSLSDFAAGGSDEGAQKFQSAIKILSHFHTSNGPHLKQVLSSLIHDSFQSAVHSTDSSLVPFLLLLASSGDNGLRNLITGLVADLFEESTSSSLVNFFNRFGEVQRKSFHQMAIHVLMLDEQESGARIVKRLLLNSDFVNDPNLKANASSSELAVGKASHQLLVNLCSRILRRFYGLRAPGAGAPPSLLSVGLLKAISSETEFLSDRALKMGCSFSAKLLLCTILACQPAAMTDLIRCFLLQEQHNSILMSGGHIDIRMRWGIDHPKRTCGIRETVRILLHLLDGMELNRSGLLSSATRSAFDAVHALPVCRQTKLLNMFYFMLKAEHGQRHRVVSALSQHAGALLTLTSLSNSEEVADKVLQLLKASELGSNSESPRLSSSILMATRLSNLLVELLSSFVQTDFSIGSTKDIVLRRHRHRLRFQRARQLLLKTCKVHPHSRIAALHVLLRSIMSRSPEESYSSQPSGESSGLDLTPKRLLDCPPPDAVGVSMRQSGQLKRRAPIESKPSPIQKMQLFSKQQQLLDLIWDLIHTGNAGQGFLVLADVFQERVFCDDPVWTYARNDRKAPVSSEAAARVYRRFCEMPNLWSILEILCTMDRVPIERIYFILLALLTHFTNFFSSTLRSGFSLSESPEMSDAFYVLRCLRLGGALPENLWRIDYLSKKLTAQDMVTVLTHVRTQWQNPTLLTKRKEDMMEMIHCVLHFHVEECAIVYSDFGITEKETSL